jgi:O-antigen ligase
MQFSLFVLLTAIIFLRPADIVPLLQGLPLYQGVILICISLSIGSILKQTSMRSLLAHPISFCMVGLLVAIILSHLSHMQLGLAFESGDAFFRICLFYFLLVATINTPERFRRYLICIVVLVTVLAALALLQYRGVIDLPGLEPINDYTDENSEDVSYVQRMCGPGIFHDPNDFCLILVLGILISIYLRDTSAPGIFQHISLSLVPVFLCSLSLTHSRGGLLTLAAGLLGYFGSRFGGRRALAILLLFVPPSLLFFSGRQTDIKLSGGTGHDRVGLWREGMALFKHSPLFGIGRDQYADQVGLVAHNSFVHSYVELGFLGGTLFLTIFVFSLRTLYALQKDMKLRIQGRLCAGSHFLAGAITAFGVGFLSLSRCNFVPTYMLFGLATSYFNLIQGKCSQKTESIDQRVFLRYVGISLVTLIVLHLFLRLSP